MRWTVFLQDQTGHAIELPGLRSHIEFELDMRDENKATLRLLKYLDAYGATIFNRLQMDDLIDDVRQLAEQAKVDASSITQLLELARRCQSDRHAYLHFYGE